MISSLVILGSEHFKFSKVWRKNDVKQCHFETSNERVRQTLRKKVLVTSIAKVDKFLAPNL